MESPVAGEHAFHLSFIASMIYEETMRTITSRPSRQQGFTLIELLVVITVIAILAGLVLQGAGYAQKKAARSRAEAEIAALSAALENYKSDNGDYPEGTNGSPSTTTSSGSNNAFLRAALAPSSGKIYFEFSKGMGTNSAALSTATNQNILDPFGECYGYFYKNKTSIKSGTNFFDLWSRAGSTTNTNQWIKNW